MSARICGSASCSAIRTAIFGPTPGSKLEKAERLGVPVIDEAGLLELLPG
jgi:DNA ligase (NAD+)